MPNLGALRAGKRDRLLRRLASVGLALLVGCGSTKTTDPPVQDTHGAGSPASAVTNTEELESLGDRHAAMQDWPRAVEFYRRAMEESSTPSKHLMDKLGQQWMNVGRPFESLDILGQAIKQYPDDVELIGKMVGLQAMLGLQWESSEQLRWLIQRGHGDLNMLLIASDLSRPQTVESTCLYALRHYPDDLRPQYAIAALRAYYGEWQEVSSLLKPVVERHPSFVPAVAYYLRALVELENDAQVLQFVEKLPVDIQSHPHYWIAAGLWAEQQGDDERAASAFWHATLLNENDGESLTRLSASLARLGRHQDSQRVSARAANVTSLRDEIDALRDWGNDSQVGAVKIAQTLEKLGRSWEATSWLLIGFQMRQKLDPEITEIYQTIRENLNGSTPWQRPESLVAANIDLSKLPVAQWSLSDKATKSESPERSNHSHRFVDMAESCGLVHTCDITTQSKQQSGLAIYQSGAGGASVIDFDLDGWPDVYLTVMDGDPLQSNSGPNRIFRNRAGQFLDVTSNAGAGDRGYAQGVAVGDYNSDGWPDLFVGNIGINRLYRNNGDGTFSDVTQASGLTGNNWTTSVAIADLDNDGHADLFEVGYCSGDAVFQDECIDAEINSPRSCSPLAFEAQPDRVWRGMGDGGFADASSQWLVNQEPGRGLGIIVGQLDSTPGIDIYVANDMTANHYWTIASDRTGDSFQLTEQAMARGLAVNERSLSQASMGIAAADVDRDGDIDFLLTHFWNEYNTFYEQVSPGLWSDRSRRTGFVEPTLPMLGYGTQFIDCDNNGTLELFIANGDIDDFTHKSRAHRQRAQLFERSTDGRWHETPGELVGDYFQGEHLGRAVATLDANRDGRTDLLVTHLFEPISLLTNDSAVASKLTRFFLRPTRSHPDGIGCRVTAFINGQPYTNHVLGGNGYQCSNERCVSFGLGTADQIDRVVIDWPDGTQENFEQLQTGGDYLLLQGATTAYSLAP
jgi:tetratricopeptide (TPR) repeat protein